MIVLIDNYDSFVYNLAQYLGELGNEVEVIRNDAIDVAGVEDLFPTHIVISPGPCTPKEAGISMDLIRAFQGRLPILGVCLGHQCIGQVFGGRIVRAGVVMHGKISRVFHDDRGSFHGLANPFIATRYHSLVIDRESLPPCLEVTAKTWDEQIMGVQHREYIGTGTPIEGVQFHPESIDTVQGMGLLHNFLERVRLAPDDTKTNRY